MPEFPTGTVTFLFTDIEGSTQLWERHPEAMKTALARQETINRVEPNAAPLRKPPRCAGRRAKLWSTSPTIARRSCASRS